MIEVRVVAPLAEWAEERMASKPSNVIPLKTTMVIVGKMKTLRRSGVYLLFGSSVQ